MERDYSVVIVTHNSAPDIAKALQHLYSQTLKPKTTVIVDSGSKDNTIPIVKTLQYTNLKVIELQNNVGFASALNIGIENTDSPWILSLNPDTRMEILYSENILNALSYYRYDRIASGTGRLVRLEQTNILDSCGIYINPTWRHFDRGSNKVISHSYIQPGFVFGATGAASFYNREALEDVQLEKSKFDPLFHSYREDAEIAFRLQQRGWKTVYIPYAVCYHRRQVLPEKRSKLSKHINYHSLKNRYLLRLYHQTFTNLILTLPIILPREIGIVLYLIFKERNSLKAYRWLWNNRKLIIERRKEIKSKKLISFNKWFFRRILPT